MGPLFSPFVASAGLLALAALAYVVALTRYSWRRALMLAALFACGFAATATGGAFLLVLVLGVDRTLTSVASVLAYLATVAVAGSFGGTLAWRWYAKCSNMPLQRTAYGGR